MDSDSSDDIGNKSQRLMKADRMRTSVFGYCSHEVYQNFIFLYGCSATKTISADSKMVHEIVHTLTNRFQKDTLTLPLPASLHFLNSTDANIEMIINSKIQPVNLHY